MKYMSDFIIYLYTMDKLIELLYYYNFEVKTFEVWIWLPNSDIDYCWWTIDKEKEIRKYKLMIISKEYWFIKWLVDNDKIDNSKFYDKNILKWFMTLTKEEKADSIIMNLSISDTPISDLIYILK